MVISGTQSMIDGIFLGRFAGVNAMASVNIAGPYMQIITGCTMVICIGTFSYLGRTLGENTNPQKAKDIFRVPCGMCPDPHGSGTFSLPSPGSPPGSQ